VAELTAGFSLLGLWLPTRKRQFFFLHPTWIFFSSVVNQVPCNKGMAPTIHQ
jgi:hypothetical protein